MLEEDVMPIHLLDASYRFLVLENLIQNHDWVRNTMFQGAPIIDDIADDYRRLVFPHNTAI